MMKARLIVMRLADMRRVHPQQITRRCALCNHEVGIYPSGQYVLQHHDTEIVCQVCAQPTGNEPLAPGAELEPFESVSKKDEETTNPSDRKRTNH